MNKVSWLLSLVFQVVYWIISSKTINNIGLGWVECHRLPTNALTNHDILGLPGNHFIIRMLQEIVIGRSTSEEKGKMRGMTKHFVHLRYLTKADTSANKVLRSPTLALSRGCFEKNLPAKRAAFLFKNVTSESISQKRTTLHNCQIKHCVVIYWSLTFIYWTRHVSSWTTGSSLTRQKTGNLFLNCADILSIILMRSSDSTVSWRHMTTLCFCLSLAILLLTHQFRWKQKQSC